MKKGLLVCAVLLSLALLTCGASLFVSADAPIEETCGANVTWKLEDTTLSIEGSGVMTNYSAESPAPWSAQASQIEVVLVHEGVESIGSYAFAGCEKLTVVACNSSSLAIGDYAFSGCKRLESVSATLNSIGKYAFEGCASLEIFSLSSGIETLSEGAFRNCTSLTKLIVPATVTLIESNVLNGCDALTRFVYCGEEDAWDQVVKATDWAAGAGDFAMRFHDFCAHEGVCDCGKVADENLDYHHYDTKGEVTIAPTHTEDGVEIFKCLDCSAVQSKNVPKKADEHTWGEEWVKLNDTQHKKTCECGATKTEDHGGEWVKDTDAQHKKVCECGHVERADHVWGVPVITPATHTEEGVKTYTCSVCTNAVKTEKIEKLPEHTYGDWTNYNESQHKHVCACGDEQFRDHVWNDGVVTVPPTHLAEGVKTYTCRDCGTTKEEAIEKLTEHTYSDYWVNHDTEKHKKVCECGSEFYGDHAWNEGKMTVAPTHLNFGVWTSVCSECGATQNEDIPKLTEHTYGDWEKHNQSQHKMVCACGDIQYRDHSWGVGVIVKEPTHTVEGTTKYVCADCGEIKNEPIAKLTAHTHGDWTKYNEDQHKRVCACGDTRYADHRWNDGEVKKAATHTVEGSILYTCADCGQTLTEALPKLEAHTFGKWKSSEDGHEKSCSCGVVMHEDHKFGKWSLVDPATAEKAGARERTCDVCGYVQSEEIPMLEKSDAVIGTGGVIGITASFAVLLGVGGFWFVSPELIGDSTFISKKKKKIEENVSVDEDTSDNIE